MDGELIYRLPSENDIEIIDELIKEYYDNDESEISNSMRLESMDYRYFVKHNKSVYLCFDEECLVGFLTIRFGLSEEMRNIYGDIGYSIRPTKRKLGYGTQALKQGLQLCKEQGYNEIIIGCFKENIGSKKVILNNGGILIDERDSYQKGKMSQYYKIEL